MEFWQLTPTFVRTKIVAKQLAEQCFGDEVLTNSLKTLFEIASITDRRTKLIILDHFLIMTAFICDYTFFVKFGTSSIKAKLTEEFFDQTTRRLLNPVLKKDFMVCIKYYAKVIQSSQNKEEFHSSVSNLFAEFVGQSNNSFLKEHLSDLSLAMLIASSNFIDERIQAGYLK